MRKHFLPFSRLVLLFVPAVVLVAQTEHITAYTGTWKLNVAKSKFSPGPGPKGETVTVAPDGRTTFEQVDTEGKSHQFSYPWSGGAETPVEGIENATVIDRIQGRTLDHTMKIGQERLTAHGVLSKDGRTATFTVTGTDEQGRPIHSVAIYEKQ